MYGKFQKHLQDELASIKEAGLYKNERNIASPQSAEITLEDGSVALNFCANNYLGLADNPRLIAAAKKAMDSRGYGMSSVRFICGTQDLHKQLEKAVSDFFHTDDTILYASCFDANGGVFEPLLTADDAIISDSLNHASIIDGSRLSFSKVLKFAHNDMNALEDKLKVAPADAPKLIVVDGVYSMSGDLAPLPTILDLADKYNAAVMVDDAHSLGVFGEQGRGTANYFGVTDRVDLIMGTFSKSFGSLGGFIAGNKTMLNYIKHNSRSLIFSASMPPANVAAVSKAIDIMLEEPERISHLWDITNFAHEEFVRRGFDIGTTESPIFPLYVRDTEKCLTAVRDALDEGVFITPVIPPAVPQDSVIIRFALMATHSKEQVEEGIDKLEKIFRRLEIIK